MELSYENKLNLAFDKPLQYKGIKIYPATIEYYDTFKFVENCLDIVNTSERDLRLLRLPYLEYLYEKSLQDESFKNKWNMLIVVLQIVLHEEQPFEMVQEKDRVYIKVYQKSDEYEKTSKKIKLLNMNFKANEEKKESTQKEIFEYYKRLDKLKKEMYKEIKIGSEDFENIRQLIMIQNDIKPQHYDDKTEKFLEQMKKKMAEAKGNNNNLDFEDLLTVLAYSQGKTPAELEGMTIRRFNRELEIALNKDDYYLYKQLELNGSIKMKQEISHWIKHYEPKGKYDDILVKNSDMLSQIGGNSKI